MAVIEAQSPLEEQTEVNRPRANRFLAAIVALLVAAVGTLGWFAVDARKHASDLDVRVARLQSQVGSNDGVAATLEQRIDSLEREIKQQSLPIDSLELEIAQKTLPIDRLQRELSTLTGFGPGSVHSVQSDVDALKSDVNGLKSCVNRALSDLSISWNSQYIFISRCY
jgi:uncharacterized coiled-coil protein SlyX